MVSPTSILPGFDPEPDDPGASAELARRYPRGGRVRVYYNPREPADSVLYPEPSLVVWAILLIGIGFVIAGLWGRR